jgi:hypothetical protein
VLGWYIIAFIKVLTIYQKYIILEFMPSTILLYPPFPLIPGTVLMLKTMED